MDEVESSHSMSYVEREDLKTFAASGRELKQVLIMISHWMRVTQDVTFSGFAANWAVANQSLGTEAIQEKWPLRGARFIADGSSEWGSAVI